VHDGLMPELVHDLDELPYPDYEDFFAQYAALGLGGAGALNDAFALEIQVETSRGCWWGQKHHCTFCGLNGLTMAFRSKSPARALEEIRYLTERYGTRRVAAVDNIMDHRYFRDFVPALRDLGLDLRLFYETKANLSAEQVALLAEAGITVIQPGIESLSTHVLGLMRKGTSALQKVQLLKRCRAHGIRPVWNLLYGFPGERPEDYAQTARIIDALHHLEPPVKAAPIRIRLDRFSPLFAQAGELGLTDLRPDRAYGAIYGLPEEDLAGLAYYFEYSYAEPRDPEAYVQPVADAILRWYDGRATAGLLRSDDGATLTLWDFRAGARQIVSTLTGAERDLYLWCDEIRSDRGLRERAGGLGVDEPALAAFVERLNAQRVLVSVEGRHLSLAVPLTPAAGVAADAREEVAAPG
jgi:ribosomal peptide maturation radical SAM protein 1